MTYQETMNLLRQIATLIGGMMTARGLMTADQATGIVTNLSTLVPAAISLGSIGWSVWSHWNMKKVPVTAVAIDPVITPSNIDKTSAQVQTKDGVMVGKIVAILLAAFLLSWSPPVFSQTRLPQTTSFLQTIQKWVSADNDAAIALATAVPDLQDPIGATCWKTFAGLGEVVQKHPLPMTLRLASDIEAARLIQMAIKKVCAEPACNQVWNDMQNQVAALAPISTPFTLQSICSKVL